MAKDEQIDWNTRSWTVAAGQQVGWSIYQAVRVGSSRVSTSFGFAGWTRSIWVF